MKYFTWFALLVEAVRNAQYSFELDQGGQGEDDVPDEGIRHKGTSK